MAERPRPARQKYSVRWLVHGMPQILPAAHKAGEMGARPKQSRDVSRRTLRHFRIRVLFHHDNARPHTARITVEKIKNFNWELLPHPPYSPDLAPSDYHLFRSMQHFLSGKNFNNSEDVKSALNEYFNSKSQKFFENGIRKLTDRWEKVIETDGQYIDD
ncbi:Mariner Mos1 transposase [Anthophora retusa]